MITSPLEDSFADVIDKAKRGLGLTSEALANESGMTVPELDQIRAGKTQDTKALSALAETLDLDPASLVALAQGESVPNEVRLEGMSAFATQYEKMTVNAYLIWDAQTGEAAAFDTGASAAPILEKIQSLGLKLRYLFLTHTHGDHVADIPALPATEVLINEMEPHPAAKTFAPGTRWQLGALSIESRVTWGHSKGGTTYVIEGLQRPVAVVGDAIFARSMGGANVSYEAALATVRKEILSLADETIIAPGHGPLTTVGEEKQHNPFFAAQSDV
jgi:hydroxyacylglutathione hydrolase